MPQYAISYVTENEYEINVWDAFYQVLAIPMVSTTQHRLDFKVGASVEHHQWLTKNPFGADCMLLRTKGGFNQIQIELDCKVLVDEVNPYQHGFIDPEETWAIMKDQGFGIDNYYYLWQTPLTRITLDLFLGTPGILPDQSPFDFLVGLKQYLHDQLSFDTSTTDAHTPAANAWELKSGVCQDYAHIFIGLCRELGIPARYTSGYLCQGLDYRGDSQLHAWVECLVPQLGWVGIDPSNNLMVDHHYIKICHGRDYYDCSPLTGVLISGGKQVSLHRVSVNAHPENQ